MSTPTIERKTYIPPAFGKEPENAGEAILAAAALLEEEGRWIQGDWFNHHDPDMPEFEDNPFCNGWGACADGALQIVTFGLRRSEHSVWTEGLLPSERPKRYGIYVQARHFLDEIGGEEFPEIFHFGYGCITELNDHHNTSREMIVDFMRRTAERWQQEQSVPSAADPITASS